MAITYNSYSNCPHVFRATSGGTVFSANLAGTTFDYFTDTAVLNDAIYFSRNAEYMAISDLKLHVGTAMAGTGITITWEYFRGTGAVWTEINDLIDNTNGFTVTGANTVQFPLQPNMTYPASGVNGIRNRVFIRARISAITSITEGGANSTTTPQVGDGRLNLTGYTDGSPCTFENIYTWCVANRPDVLPQKVGTDTYVFPNAILNVASTLRSSGENIFMGNGCMIGPQFDLSYAHLGTKVGTDGWTAGTNLYLCYRSPGEKLVIGTSNAFKMYGGAIKEYRPIVYGVTCTPSGYFNMGRGEWIGVYQEKSGYFISADSNRCIVDGSLIMSSTVSKFPNNLQIADPTTRLFVFYSRNQDITNLVYALPSTCIYNFGGMYGPADGNINFIDCNPLIPEQSSEVKVVYRQLGTALNITKFFYYNSTTDTYTDYTTEANSTATDDVPIGGEVGDIFYICRSTTTNTTLQTALDFTITPQNNDYEYKMEYYSRNGWMEREFNSQFDQTNNFSQSGTLFVRNDGNATTTNSADTITINGQAGHYIRFTITKKGTGTPTISRVRYRLQNGITSGITSEKYSYNLNIKAITGNTNIEGANVMIKDAEDIEVFEGLTDASGNIEEQQLVRKQTLFDAQSSEDDYNYKDIVKTPHSIRIRKYGYNQLEVTKLVAGKASEVSKLTTNAFITEADKSVVEAYTGIDITGNTITITEDHTMQEVYDFSQSWAESNINCNEPYTTADGQTFFSKFDLVLDGCHLSGVGKISMVVNTVTYLNDATSSVDIIAIDGTHTNIKLTNLVDGSRIQVYDIDEDTELFNDTNGTELILPIIWNEDKDIRIRVMYVDGSTAKKWYETTATLTANGINLRIDQEDDTVYNEIAVDGSTVDECSIDGTNLVIDIEDDDAHTTGQRIYAFEVYWLSTENGIRDQALYIDAIDSTRFVFEGGLKIKNISEHPLTIDNCNIYPSEGIATDIFDLTGNTIFLNSKIVVPFAYNVNGATEEQFNTLISKTRVLDKKVDDTQSRVITFTE